MAGCYVIKKNLKVSLRTISLYQAPLAWFSSEDSKSFSASINKVNVVRDCSATQLIKRLIN